MTRQPACECCEWRVSCIFCTQSEAKPRIIRQIDFKKHSTVYSVDLPADCLFVVQKGSVSLTSVDKVGNSRIAQLLGPGRTLGLDALLWRRTRVFTAQCREDSALCCVPIDSFEHFLSEHPLGCRKLIRTLDEDFHTMAIEKLHISGQPVRRRVEFAIKSLTETVVPSGTRGSRPNIRQWEIAQFVGTSCETICRHLKQQRIRPQISTHQHNSKNQ